MNKSNILIGDDPRVLWKIVGFNTNNKDQINCRLFSLLENKYFFAILFNKYKFIIPINMPWKVNKILLPNIVKLEINKTG